MNEEIKEALAYIDPTTLDYQEWLNVGMAIKEAGGSCNLWDEWSRRDPARYDGGCWAKWGSFTKTGITEKTLFKMAIERGYRSSSYSDSRGRELMDGEILNVDEHYRVIDQDMIDSKTVPEPVRWDPLEDIRRYLSVLFAPNDHVSYCVDCYQDKDGKWHPKGRVYDRTAGRLLEELDSANDVEDVFYSYNHECGVWVSFNPMDGNGGKIDNVTDFKYTLIESDTQDIEVQYALMTKLELPIAALVHSGNKSIHAIVRIEAGNEKEYARRVDYLFKVCKKNGLDVDTSTKNPSRLSRMPGFWRGSRKQYLIATNIGKESWNEWVEYIESINDDLPDPEDFNDIWEDLPELAPELIQGVLRKGHKMLLSGGSKTGKSMLMIQLAIAIASGGHWLNRYCEQGKVLYVNLEIDSSSFARRIAAACKQRGITPDKINHNLRVWNMRGHSTQLDKLTPKLIRRCEKENFTAIIIDPIYKVMMGDENKAGDMAQFCNQFDAIATKLNCAVIYVHHFSKGEQGKKASIDRASGSGVFARDPDTIATVTKLYNVRGTYPAVRVEFTLREFPELKPIDAWYQYPIHVVDTDGDLKEATVEEKKKKTHEENLQDFVDNLEIAFENLCDDEDGNPREVPQPELIEYMDMERTAFTRWYKEAKDQGLTNIRKRAADKKIGSTATFYRRCD
ncbi:MAG: AAA family ATPase [Prevotella sp.]|nr:AAA family ATPase [Prevotella sp.]MBR2096624.1 AAA family ATPase [Prevotella sp.]